VNFSVRVSDFLIGRLGLPAAGDEFSKLKDQPTKIIGQNFARSLA